MVVLLRFDGGVWVAGEVCLSGAYTTTFLDKLEGRQL